jgi:hypothetical protein
MTGPDVEDDGTPRDACLSDEPAGPLRIELVPTPPPP